MPGHHISRDEMEKSVKILEDLIQSHSVIYLLMDTRESRNLELFFTLIKNHIFSYKLLYDWLEIYCHDWTFLPFLQLVYSHLYSQMPLRNVLNSNVIEIWFYYLESGRDEDVSEWHSTLHCPSLESESFQAVGRKFRSIFFDLGLLKWRKSLVEKMIFQKNESDHGASSSKLISQFKDGCQL